MSLPATQNAHASGLLKAFVRRAHARADINASYRGAVPTRLDDTFGSLLNVGYSDLSLSDYGSLSAMAFRAKQLERHNTLAHHILTLSSYNVLGVNPILRPASTSPEFNKQAKVEIDRVTRGTNFDALGRKTFGQVCRRLYRLKKRDGDCGSILINQNGYPKVQIVPQSLITSPGRTRGQRIVDGIDLWPDNRHKAYYVRRDTPRGGQTHARIASDDFVFLRNPAVDENAVRGETAFSGSFELFDQSAGVIEAVVVAMRVAACQSIVVEMTGKVGDHPDDAVSGSEISDEAFARFVEEHYPEEFEAEPGMAKYLRPGQKMSQFKPEHPSQKMVEAIELFSRICGLKFGVPLCDILFDYTGMNYTVSRALRIAIERYCGVERDDIDGSAFSRWYPWIIAMGIKYGRITAPAPDDWDHYKAVFQPMAVVDEGKEMDVVESKMRLGFDSETHLSSEKGLDYEETLRQRKESRELRKQYGEPEPQFKGMSKSSEKASEDTDEEEDDDVSNDGGDEDEDEAEANATALAAMSAANE